MLNLSFTEKITDFIRETRYSAIPKEAVFIAKQSFIDTIGVSLAGSTQPVAKLIKSLLKDVGGKKQCTVVGLGLKTSVLNVAFANGVFAHCLDYDDSTSGIVGHPSPPVIPAALAIAELTGASGKQTLTAYMIGVEVECILGHALNPSHYQKGWHTTGTLGTFGALAAAGKLLELDREQMLHAIGIAASESAGLRANFGTMTKSFHAGRAAENGVLAALLAKKGFTADKHILEKEAGYFAAMKGKGVDYTAVEKLGKPWQFITGIVYKLYPCCLSTQAALNAILPLIWEHDIKPEQVERVEVGECQVAWDGLPHHEPKTALEGMFSMEYCIALALLEREAKLGSWTDEKVRNPRTVESMKKVKPYVDDELNASIPYELGDNIAKVKVRLKDGRKWDIRGELKSTPEQIIEKFRMCASTVLADSKVEDLRKTLQRLEKVEKIRTLMQLMCK